MEDWLLYNQYIPYFNKKGDERIEIYEHRSILYRWIMHSMALYWQHKFVGSMSREVIKACNYFNNLEEPVHLYTSYIDTISSSLVH